MGTRFCPNCGSEDVDLADGGITGKFICNDCGFTGTIFPERTFLGKDDDEDEMPVENFEKETKKTGKKASKVKKTEKKKTKSKVKKMGKKK